MGYLENITLTHFAFGVEVLGVVILLWILETGPEPELTKHL